MLNYFKTSRGDTGVLDTGRIYQWLRLCQCQLAAFGRSNGGFVSANSRPSAARTLALSVPTRGLRPLERWLCQCQAWVLPTF
ncbi:hypothetical protein Ddc_23239 [Ditylenchus destructor]|nr:hypothetical protein Ddc_23239 [Ditylenchus destructor]